jgi:hypothetical protein
MPIRFKFDKDAFDRVTREHIEQVVADTADTLQAALDKVHAEYPGPDAPLDSVRSALVSALADTGLTLTESQLTSYAEKLAKGHPIDVQTRILE